MVDASPAPAPPPAPAPDGRPTFPLVAGAGRPRPAAIWWQQNARISCICSWSQAPDHAAVNMGKRDMASILTSTAESHASLSPVLLDPPRSPSALQCPLFLLPYTCTCMRICDETTSLLGILSSTVTPKSIHPPRARNHNAHAVEPCPPPAPTTPAVARSRHHASTAAMPPSPGY